MTKLMSKTIIATIAFVILYILSFLYFDRTTALFCKNFIGTDLFIIGKYISYLGAGSVWAVIILLSLIWVVIHDYRFGKSPSSRIILYIVVTLIVGNVVGGGFRFLLGRYRPAMLYAHNLYGFHFFSFNVISSSTPSGHAIRIFALAGCLSTVFKRWRWLFLIVAICVGLSRIIIHAHYPSDVLFGAYLGLLSAVWVREYITLPRV